MLTIAAAGSFKTKVLEGWQRRFGRIAWGIGNSAGDRKAYETAQIPHVILGGESTSQVNNAQYYPAQDWTRVGTIIRQNRERKH